MDNENRKTKSKENGQHNIKPSRYVYFLNNELVRLVHSNRSANICTLYNYIQDKEQTMLLSDFKKHRKKAFTFINVLKIFRRSRVHFERMINSGVVPEPVGAVAGGKRVWQKMSFYSEDHLFIIRESISKIHIGRPRKDGRVTSRKDVPTEKELRSLIGDAIMLYTKTKNGDYIPIWTEETW